MINIHGLLELKNEISSMSKYNPLCKVKVDELLKTYAVELSKEEIQSYSSRSFGSSYLTAISFLHDGFLDSESVEVIAKTRSLLDDLFEASQLHDSKNFMELVSKCISAANTNKEVFWDLFHIVSEVLRFDHSIVNGLSRQERLMIVIAYKAFFTKVKSLEERKLVIEAFGKFYDSDDYTKEVLNSVARVVFGDDSVVLPKSGDKHWVYSTLRFRISLSSSTDVFSFLDSYVDSKEVLSYVSCDFIYNLQMSILKIFQDLPDDVLSNMVFMQLCNNKRDSDVTTVRSICGIMKQYNLFNQEYARCLE